MRNFFVSICIWILIAAGSFLAVCGALDYWQSRHGQSEIASDWQRQEEVHPETPESPASPRHSGRRHANATRVPHQGEAIAKLTIPRLDTVLYIVEGTDDNDLKRGPGHMTGTALPGQNGNCVIAGHRDTHFRVLKNIQDGDEVILERSGHRYRYRVSEMMLVTPDNTASLRPTNQPVLNLVTCYPFQYVGSAPKRFIVHADLENPSLEASR